MRRAAHAARLHAPAIEVGYRVFGLGIPGCWAALVPGALGPVSRGICEPGGGGVCSVALSDRLQATVPIRSTAPNTIPSLVALRFELKGSSLVILSVQSLRIGNEGAFV